MDDLLKATIQGDTELIERIVKKDQTIVPILGQTKTLLVMGKTDII